MIHSTSPAALQLIYWCICSCWLKHNVLCLHCELAIFQHLAGSFDLCAKSSAVNCNIHMLPWSTCCKVIPCRLSPAHSSKLNLTIAFWICCFSVLHVIDCTCSSLVYSYVQAVPGVPAIQGELNPATWMLEITTPGMEHQLGVDFAQVYKESDLARYFCAMTTVYYGQTNRASVFM